MSKFLLKNNNGRDLAIKKLNSLEFETKTGKKISYRFEVVKNIKRTLSQNSYYRVCLGIYSKDCGHTPDELHEIFKVLFCEEYPEEKKNFIKAISAMGRTRVKELSTTELNTTTFTRLVEFVKAHCAKEGCELPEANGVPDHLREGFE